MRGRLETYLHLWSQYDLAYKTAGYDYSDHCRQIDDDATQLEPTVLEILRRLDPNLTDGFTGPAYSPSTGKRRVLKALGILRDQAEWAVRLAPTAPTLSADRMHPMIWNAAATVWGTGEYKIAVQQAAVALSAHIKSKAKSPLNERDLVAQVFKPEPATLTQNRLHFPGDPADRNWQSRQQGLHLVAQGAFAGIRNIAVHAQAEWSEHEALEHLAVLSVTARWADDTQLVTP